MIGLHHVQIAAPAGGEDDARAFWGEGVGLTEVDKPAALRAKGGCWFRAFDDGRVTAEIHVGIETPFTPDRKAHPALVVPDGNHLDALAARLRSAGHEVDESERSSFDGYLRFHTSDPFGNRVEVLAPLT